ncbi:cytochrome P450 [Mycena crocata]|nr:cytochrome P450 [Mycena crocata]
MVSFLPLTTSTWALLLGLAFYEIYRRNRTCRKPPLPPGPRGLPLVGNAFQIPACHPWETYMAWSKEYGAHRILHLDLAGTSLIVLSSLEATAALLERRSAIYSDRPRLPMVAELMGWDFNIGASFLTYSDEEIRRAHRRLFKRSFTPKASLQYRPKQLTATHALIQRLLEEPDAFMDHFRQWASEIIMSVAYGIEVLPTDDPYVELAHKAVRTLSEAGVPGKYLVDSLPLLKYVPEWMPGAGFKRNARLWRELAHAMRDVPLAETKRQMVHLSIPQYCLTYINLTYINSQQMQASGTAGYYTENTVRDTAGTMYVGGADTTVSSLATLILGMLANSEAQRKAQKEIDTVTGGRCLPTFEDEAAMPYVGAIVQETLRWKNVVCAVPHFLAVEDEYKGYRIPANSIVIGNAWAILHDETVYPDPYTFNPERFLLGGKLDTAAQLPDTPFGFGRRLCPGRHMAISSLWISVASILAAFQITKARDEQGREMEPSYAFDSGFINSPLPFKCTIKPRSQEAPESLSLSADSSDATFL